MKRTAVIIGTGSYAPQTSASSEEILRDFYANSNDTADDSFTQYVMKQFGCTPDGPEGFRDRHIMSAEETTATMAIEAGKRALNNANLDPGEVDLIIFSCDPPDFIMPASSARIQHELGAINAGFFDINAACAGFTIGVDIATKYIQGQPEITHILVLAGYGATKFVKPDDITFKLLFGDGAGAVVLRAINSTEYGVQKTTIHGKGQYWDYFGVYAGGSWKHFSEDACKENFHYVRMLKKFAPDININNWPPVINHTLAKTGWKPEQVDKVFFTQTKLENIIGVCKKIEWDPSISYNIMDRYGYTGCACVPMGMDDACKNNLLHKGDKILICTSGTGTVYAVMTMVWGY